MKSIISISCGALLAVSLSLSPAGAQSLKEVLELTYATNPALKAGRAELRATDELGTQARADGRPTLNGQALYEAADGDYDPGRDLSELFGGQPGGGMGGDMEDDEQQELLDEALTGSGGTGTQQIGVELRQPLFQGFRVKNSIAQSEAQIDAAQAQLVATEQDVLFEAVSAYLAVITAGETVDFTQTSLELLSRQQEQTEARFDAGQVTKTDVAQAEARAASASADLIRARSSLTAARSRFERVTGRMPGSLEAEPPLPALPETMDQAYTIAQQRNPLIVAAREREEASSKAIKVAKGYLSPSVTAKATYGYAQNQFIDGDQSENATIGAEITIPLYQGGQTWSGIRQARETNRADRYRLIDTERQLREQVQTAWQQMQAARAAYEATEPALAASELAYEGLTLEGEYGKRTTLEVLDGEAQLLQTRLSRLQAREQYYLAAYQLLQVTGQLTARDLGLDVAYYDPDENRDDVAHRWFGTGRSED